jgi:hypothetical protein
LVLDKGYSRGVYLRLLGVYTGDGKQGENERVDELHCGGDVYCDER